MGAGLVRNSEEQNPFIQTGPRQPLKEIRPDRFQAEVLIVEDDPAVLSMLEHVLKRLGFAVRLARGGREAVQVYERYQDTINLVLMDVQMPDGDGPWALVRMRRINPQVKVAFMSGDTGKYSSGDLLASGALRVLEKPFRGLTELTVVLRELAFSGGSMPGEERPPEGGPRDYDQASF